MSDHVLIAPEGDTSRRRHAHLECVAAANLPGRPTRPGTALAAAGPRLARATLAVPSARSSGDRALPCGGRGRMFESCRAHFSARFAAHSCCRNGEPAVHGRGSRPSSVSPPASRSRGATGTEIHVRALAARSSRGLPRRRARSTSSASARAARRSGRLLLRSRLSAPSHLRAVAFSYSAQSFTVRARRTLQHAALVCLPPAVATTGADQHDRAGPRGRDQPRRTAQRCCSEQISRRLDVQVVHAVPRSTRRALGRGAADVSLYDGTQRLIHIDRTITVCRLGHGHRPPRHRRLLRALCPLDAGDRQARAVRSSSRST